MKQDEFIRLSRLIDEAKQRLDAEDEIAREHKSRERTEREPSEQPRRLCTRCQRNARIRGNSSIGAKITGDGLS